MALFDKLKNNDLFEKNTKSEAYEKNKTFVFNIIPETYEDFIAMKEADMTSPFDTAAMTLIALCNYPFNSERALKMLDFLRGPRPMNGIDKQFIADRFRDKDYVPRSYLKGAIPDNNYLPSEPYSVTVFSNSYSFDEEGYAKLYIASGGADSPRSVQLRLAKDGKWYLWEQYLLSGIRQPASTDPWA